MINIFAIVEGHGDVAALPILLRRMAHELHGHYEFNCLTPFRLPRGKLVKDDDLSRAVQIGLMKLAALEGRGHIIILMDADDDCPAEMANAVRQHLGARWNEARMSFVLAKMEYEAWFIAANLSQIHHRQLRPETPVVADPEAIRAAKAQFERTFMLEGSVYSETLDQPKFTSVMDLAVAQRSSSFAKLVRDFGTLFT